MNQYSSQLAEKQARIELLEATLRTAREQLVKAQDTINELSSPPLGLGVFVSTYSEDQAVIMVNGNRHIVAYDPEMDLEVGQEVILNEAMSIIEAVSTDIPVLGEALTVIQVLEDNRLIVGDEEDNQFVVFVSVALAGIEFQNGQRVLVNTKIGLVTEILPDENDAENLLLENVPDITYSDVGGLSSQIEEIQDAIELPFLYKELHAAYKLKSPKGVLLYGPPGSGKTLLAKAVANSLAKKAGHENGYFININGPELLSKWVGETERQIREVFRLARDKSAGGVPVVVFFDEIESLFPIRGSGVSSDTEKTIVPQILSEIDGVEEGMDNVIVIGATNRADLVDPALLRPGRLDIKIKIDRPDKEGTADIMALYLNYDVPVNTVSRSDLISAAVESLFAETTMNEFLEVIYQRGENEKLYFKDFLSGAMVMNIVNRAKRIALKGELNGDPRGITQEHMLAAINQEFHENEDLPNTTNYDDWARISGRKGEQIVNVRSLVQDKKRTVKQVENIDSQQYL